LKKTVRTALNLALAAVFLFSIGMFLLQQREKSLGGSTYENALALASSEQAAAPQKTPVTEESAPSPEPRWVPAQPEEEDPYLRQLEEINLESLREVNPDVVGWILIPDTVISYPIMQGTDNDYYLKHTWDGKRYAVGSIFLEYLCNADLTEFHTIVYGHNMNDGSMFASLREYRDQDYWEEHPYVYIRNDRGVYRYEIFSSYLANVKGDAYSIGFTGENTKVRFLEQILQESVIDTEVEPEHTDRILTLSTCSGRGSTTRWVVHARLKMILEQPTA